MPPNVSKKKIHDLRKVEKRERTFATLAKEEGKGAASRAKSEQKKGLKESAKDSRWETRVDNQFSELRKKKADSYRKKMKASE